ncbi:unnamed protein product [Linum tenue]|uniref:WW domain-containing protein n=2 Tax=Linum tenue TaxID=586396 RepID=A0AAV0Q762_9ROSI|nr:unnamed protein product [Linum tenue]
MGKRKERRRAALNNTGRRVKLDLFAEPSGDLGGSSVHDEVVGGGDNDPTQRAGLPNSPSLSSGQQPQNPLLLLGQYSDDELDVEKDKHLINAANNSPSADLSNQDIHPAEGNDKDSNAFQDPSIQSNDQQDMDADPTNVDAIQSVNGVDNKDHDTTVHDDTSKSFISAEQASEGGVSAPLIAGDVSLGWRMVLHEESNQYYYWNPGTGETSWEAPIALAHMGYMVNLEASVAEDTGSLPVSKSQNDSISVVELAHSFPAPTIDGLSGVICTPLSEEPHSSMQQIYASRHQVESKSLKSEGLEAHLLQNELGSNPVSVHGQSGEGYTAQDEPRHAAIATDIHREGRDTSTSLRTQCQCLLERLKSLRGFDRWPQDHELMLKYIIELETRLSDIESLSSHGLQLLPFWTHTEVRLKQLEDKINSEIYRLAVSAQMDDDVELTPVVCEGKPQHQDGLFNESPADAAGGRKSPTTVNVIDSSHIEGASDSVSYAVHTSPSEAAGKVSENDAMNAEVNETAELKPDLVSIEDVDMDIEMEVEDAPVNSTPSENNIHTGAAPSEQFIPSNAPLDYTPLVAGEWSAVPPEEEWIPPPPPDTEHIPPPPPDDEQVPPLPPDEPPDSSYSMPACSGAMVQSANYPEHYGYPYMDSNFQYYGCASNLPSGSFYVHVDGSQVAIPHTSLYYGPVSTTYAETPPVMVNPLEQVASYNHLQTLPPGTLLTGQESSNLPTNVGTMQSDSSYIINAANSVESEQYVKPEPPSNVNSQAPDVSNDEGTVSSSIHVLGAAAAASAPLNAKVQSKVSRGKKRTVAVSTSLRSNKKVSSLVDKWKAAKEELKENDEDEPENALEILEKKRQREIEEWRAKQITSGEAKDNANFQPLGGDWREKVKRRRALAAKEEAKKATKVDVADAKQPPNLAELSKGLPSGWQVYWDEASKQVYYGNAVTSETSWTRPTN